MKTKATKLPVYLQRKLDSAKVFKFRKMPDYETEAGILEALADLDCELSPENLCCDGELSKTETAKKFREIKTAWKFLEKRLGRKVPCEADW